MPAKDLGRKFLCFNCSAKFYDLKRPNPICPKCGADQRNATATKPAEGRKSRLAAAPKPAPPPPAAHEEEDEEAVETDDEDEEDKEDEA